jgi:gliding motility-associated-like protein
LKIVFLLLLKIFKIKFSNKIITLWLVLSFFKIEINAQFQLNGDASVINCKCYQLTPDMGNKAGSVWNINLIDLNQPFDYNFTVNLGCNNTSQWAGADGMVFALQPLNTSIGSSGGQMGLGGVSPSLGIYIDTYQNTAHGDMLNDHISINLNGDVIHTSLNNIAGPYDLGEVENCIAEPLRITWDPVTTLLNVYYNNLLVLNYTGDIVNNVFNGNPMVFWGFTASTGGASNFHQFCIDVPDLIIDSSNVIIESEKCNQINGSITGINISGGIGPFSWTWNNTNSLSLDTFNLNGGSYFLELTDGMGCISNHNFHVPDLSGPEIDSSLVVIKNEDCGKENGSISNITVTSTADSIQFYWNNFLSDSLNISNLIADNYQLVILDNNNCRDTVNFIVVDTNYHNISINFNSAQLEPDEPIDFFQNSIDSSIINYWTFGDDSSSIEYEPTHSYKYPGEYQICLIAGNEFSCFDTSCLEITILPNEIIIPNIFSPNKDLTNDKFIIYGINDRFEIKIYNRWGNIVFEENPYNNSWNGINMNGKILSEGQYFYILKSVEEKIEINGSIMLIR